LFKYIAKSDIGFVPLEENQKMRTRIERIRLVKYAASEMLDEIEKKGFIEARFFPNIDNIAKSIKKRIYKTKA